MCLMYFHALHKCMIGPYNVYCTLFILNRNNEALMLSVRKKHEKLCEYGPTLRPRCCGRLSLIWISLLYLCPLSR